MPAAALPPLGGVGEGLTITNPLINADVPDMDIIRVGQDFYLMSTTMHLMPGAPVMHSRDLKNWETASYLFQTINDTPQYDLIDGTVYGRGQWATSLRYRGGQFYALFSPNDAPFRSYIYTAKSAAGPWTLHTRMRHFHDASLFFDDDNRAYIFSATGQLTELAPDLKDVQPGGIDMKLNVRDSTETGLLEGSRVIKRDGKYYLLMISWPAGKLRREVCYRADKITGPYEKRVILQSEFDTYPYAGQGTIVDDAQGNWYGLIFQDRGAIGRVPCLMPCRWVDGWPMLGDEQGRIPKTMTLPLTPDNGRPFVVSDDFSTTTLDNHWQWNHNPVATAFSLYERPGWLRLRTARVVDNIFLAPNTLSQRMEGPASTATVALDIQHMADGDRAGLSAFNGDEAEIAVSVIGKRKFIIVSTNTADYDSKNGKKLVSLQSNELGRVEITGRKQVFFRLEAVFQAKDGSHKDLATFSYSLDGKRFTTLGEPFHMRYDYRKHFMGSRFAIFNYATKQLGGYADIDYFHYTKAETR